MPHYRHHDKELLHIHVPKTGGTSITKAVEYHDGLVSFMRKAPVRQCGNVPPQHMSIEYTKKFFDLKKVPSFAVIRHPWHRLVSEYVWDMKRANWETNNLEKFIKVRLASKDFTRYANHFLPQHKFVNEDVELFRYDQYDKVIEYVGDVLGFKNFTCEFVEGRRITYDVPSINIVGPSAKKMYETLYAKDLDLYHSL